MPRKNGSKSRTKNGNGGLAKRKRPSKADLVRNVYSKRGEFPPDVMQWVLYPEHEIGQNLEMLINRILADRKKRVHVFLTTLVRKKIERLAFIYQQLPLVENEIFQAKRIKNAKLSDLVRLLSVAGDQASDESEFLRYFVTAAELQAEPATVPEIPEAGEPEQTTTEETQAVLEMSGESRKRVSRVLLKMLQIVRVANKEHDGSMPPPATTAIVKKV